MQSSAEPLLKHPIQNLHIHRLPLPPQDVLAEILDGLQQPQKRLSAKFFYDEQGSKLFDVITELPEYYPTRTEQRIFQEHHQEVCEALGKQSVVIEPGSGNCEKARMLLRESDAQAYVPIEISDIHLVTAAEQLAAELPHLEVHAVCADFTQTQELPGAIPEGMRVGFFPGSTIGNFEPQDAIALLRTLKDWVGSGGSLLIGVDTKKDPQVLHDAYNDHQGVTAQFNLNMLHHINRVLGADFDLDQFEHHAFYNEKLGRIEMHLRSLCRQQVRIGTAAIEFHAGETIHTENSYKYEAQEFAKLAEQAGFDPQHCWQDPQRYFGVHYLRVP
jgi:dimethylhistidine N-methyltransferase